MLTANYLMDVAEPMVELWSQVECDILDDVARRLVKSSGALTETARWQIVKAREMGILQTDISKVLARATKTSEREMYQLIVDACKKSLAFDDAIYLKAGYYPLPLTQSQALMDVITAGCRKTGGLMKNFTNTTARTASMAFENSLDRAYLQVQSGAFSYSEALKRSIIDLADKGIEKIAYPSGHVDRMDVATRRALITGLNQTSAELQLTRASELQTEYVETSSHAGARPTHAEWQGQVFQLVGRGKYENFYDATGYGTGDGLCGWNCRHSFFPYFEGISERAYEHDPAARLGKSNDQVYEESQRQRYYERQVRDSRRKCATLSAAKDAATDPQTKAALETEFQNAAVTLKRRQAALDEYCDKTGRTKDVDRLFVSSYNRNVSSKTTWAARKATTPQAAKAGAATQTTTQSPVSGFKKIKGTHTIQQDLTASNPNYAKGKIWQINCQRCCPTYEMRRRGYDVTAKPYVSNSDPAYVGWRRIFDGADWKDVGAKRTNICKDRVESIMKSWGDGARAEVYVQWKAGSAHVFMSENHGGVISFIDPQSGSTDVVRYFDRIKPSKTEICRIDQLTPTNLIKECCK